MGLISDYEKVQAGRSLKDWGTTFDVELAQAEKVMVPTTAVLPYVKHLEDMIKKMVVLESDYPIEAAEVKALRDEKQAKLDAFKVKHGLK